MDREFVRDRDEAFSSGSINEIKAYCKKYNVEIPEDETVFLAGIHKARANLFLSIDTKVSLEQYLESTNWLQEHGYSPVIRP